MPALSLVVCLYQQRDLLERMLNSVRGHYDELIVVHDGPDTANIRQLVQSIGGKFFEGPRTHQQEPHLPFAWGKAAHDWILRLDADEFPSDDLKKWLQDFRRAPEPAPDISGYTCIWPLWNGHRAVSKKIADGRIFILNRQRVRFFGMAEQVPVPDGRYEPVDLVLHHQPKRKSYGLYNVLMRKQAYHWRRVIAQALLGKPQDLNCWRWEAAAGWPPVWEQIRQHPFRTAANRLVMSPLRALRDQWKVEGRIYPFAALSNPMHHALLCLVFWKMRRKQLAAAKETK